MTGTSEQLLAAMGEYGYALFEPNQMTDPNKVLTALSSSDDVRVLEGFPVVLANALEKNRSAVDLRAAEASLNNDAARERFRRLTALSFYLFGVFGFENLKPAGHDPLGENSELQKELRDCMEHDKPFSLGQKTLDPARVKRTFLSYFVQGHKSDEAENKARLREEFRREFNLSLFFAPKQRDLLQKKLRGEALTKTEREYFSRVVKKKLLALADPDLHRLAQKALQ
ncbi:MAG: hypothetical protein ACHQ2Z_00535 [Elusimicrobiota bacterium]